MGRDGEGVENKTTFYVSSRDVRIVCPRLNGRFSQFRERAYEDRVFPNKAVCLYRVRQKYLTILQNSCEWNRWREEFVLERLSSETQSISVAMER